MSNVITVLVACCTLADIENREKDLDHVMHLINIDIQDNHEEATIGAFMICEMVTMVSRV